MGVAVSNGDWTFVAEVKWVNRFGSTDFRRFERALNVAGPAASVALRSVWLPTESVSTIPVGPNLRMFTLRDFV